MDAFHLAFLREHAWPLCFAGAFLGGSSFTLFFATLAGGGWMHPVAVFTAAFLGNFLSDAAWFFAARSGWAERATSGLAGTSAYARLQAAVRRFHSHELAFFILVKFAYGVRKLAIVYFGRDKYDPGKFLRFDAAAVLVITSVVVVAGWSVGRGAGLFYGVFQNVQRLVTALAVLAALWVLMKKAAGKLLERL